MPRDGIPAGTRDSQIGAEALGRKGGAGCFRLDRGEGKISISRCPTLFWLVKSQNPAQERADTDLVLHSSLLKGIPAFSYSPEI